MSPHVTDHPRTDTPSRTARYLEIARDEAPRKATLALQARQERPTEAARVKQFVRIARGHSA
jgi:hypothetical protein